MKKDLPTTDDWLAAYDAAPSFRPVAPKRAPIPDDTKEKRAAAAKKAAETVQKAAYGRPTPYGEKKGINPDMYLSIGKNVIVPIYQDGELVNVQTIKPEKYNGNDKWPIAGGPMSNVYHQIGKNNETVVVAEGWATGARVHQITGLTVIVVFSAGNLGKWIKPEWCKNILIAADNDKSDAGEIAAAKLQERYPDAMSVLPPTIGTDWADYTADEVNHYWHPHIPRTLDINEKFLPDYVLNRAAHTMIRSQHETGKTTAVIQWTKRQVDGECSVLYVCQGRAQVSDAVARLNAEIPNAKFDDYRNIADVNCSNQLAICVDSLVKVDHQFDAVVFDECEQLSGAPLKHDLYSAKANLNARKELAHHMAWLARSAKYTLWLDADAGSLTEQVIKHSGINPLRVTNAYQTLSEATLEFVGMDELESRMTAAKQQWHAYSPSKKTTKRMHRRYSAVLANGETDNDQLLADIANNKPITSNLITNSAIQAGVSIDIDQHNIETVFARIKVGRDFPSLEAQVQALRRARGVKHFVICVESKPPKTKYCIDPDQIVYEEITEPRLQNRAWLKRRNELITSSPITGKMIDPLLSDLYGHHKAKLHHQWNDPKQWLIDCFTELGATIYDSELESDTGANTREADKEAREQIKCDDMDTIATTSIPELSEHKNGIRDAARKALAKAKHDAGASNDIEARKFAQREYLKPGYIKGLDRCKDDMRPAKEHAKEDARREASQDPLNKPKSLLVAMRKEIIGLCAHVLDGREFSAGDLESVLRPWLIENGSLFAKMSGRRCGDPMKMRVAQTLVTLLEHYGIWIDRIDGKEKRYCVNTDDPRNAAATRMLVTYCHSSVLKNNKSPAAA